MRSRCNWANGLYRGKPNISFRPVAGLRRSDLNTAGKWAVFVAGSERLTAEQSTSSSIVRQTVRRRSAGRGAGRHAPRPVRMTARAKQRAPAGRRTLLAARQARHSQSAGTQLDVSRGRCRGVITYTVRDERQRDYRGLALKMEARDGNMVPG